MSTEEIIVLASSLKRGNRCVAGLSTRSSEWVRPVSALPGGLRKFQCRVEDRWPEPLDIVSFDYEKHCEDPAQPENVLIDDAEWELTGRLDPGEAYVRFEDQLDPGPSLFGNRGKAVTEDSAAEGVAASLALVEPEGSVSYVLSPREETYGKWKPRAAFTLNGASYELGLTDIDFRSAVLEAGVGTHTAEDLGFPSRPRTLLTISLGEGFEGFHHKLVAAVLMLP